MGPSWDCSISFCSRRSVIATAGSALGRRNPCSWAHAVSIPGALEKPQDRSKRCAENDVSMRWAKGYREPAYCSQGWNYKWGKGIQHRSIGSHGLLYDKEKNILLLKIRRKMAMWTWCQMQERPLGVRGAGEEAGMSTVGGLVEGFWSWFGCLSVIRESHLEKPSEEAVETWQEASITCWFGVC